MYVEKVPVKCLEDGDLFKTRATGAVGRVISRRSDTTVESDEVAEILVELNYFFGKSRRRWISPEILVDRRV